MPRLNTTALAAACLAAASTLASAGTILVGGHTGLVNRVALPGGSPAFFGTCGGPIDSMHVLNGNVYLGTNIGWVYRIKVGTGQLLGSFQIPVDASAMTSYQGNLLIADTTGLIITVNPTTGQLIRQFNAPSEVHSMVVHGNDLLVGGPAGVWQGSSLLGGFNYAACGCIGQLEGLAFLGNNLWGVDANGALAQFDINNGFLLAGHWLGVPATSLASDQGKLIITTSDSRILTVDPTTGQILATQNLTIDAHAVVLESTPACTPDLTATNIPGAFGYGIPNGMVSNEDFFFYLAAFTAGNAAIADLTQGAVAGSPGYGTPNGVVNNEDFFYYLAVYSAGC